MMETGRRSLSCYWLPIGLVAAALWLGFDGKGLLIGYYLWLASFAAATAGFWLARPVIVTRSNTRPATTAACAGPAAQS